MIKLVIALIFPLLTGTVSPCDLPPGDLVGKYVYKMNMEYDNPYSSIIWIKKKNRYEREVSNHGVIRKSGGSWEIKGDSVELVPDKKYKLQSFTMLIGNGFLKIGDVGVHEKVDDAK